MLKQFPCIAISTDAQDNFKKFMMKAGMDDLGSSLKDWVIILRSPVISTQIGCAFLLNRIFSLRAYGSPRTKKNYGNKD